MVPRRAAVDRQHRHAGVLGDGLEHLGDLHGEFAGRHEHEPERLRRLGDVGDAGEHRHAEGERLAGAGLGPTAHVAAGHRDRDRLGLDVERLGEPAGGEALVDARRHPEFGEAGRRLDGREHVEAREVRGVDVAGVGWLAGGARRTPLRRGAPRRAVDLTLCAAAYRLRGNCVAAERPHVRGSVASR